MHLKIKLLWKSRLKCIVYFQACGNIHPPTHEVCFFCKKQWSHAERLHGVQFDAGIDFGYPVLYIFKMSKLMNLWKQVEKIGPCSFNFCGKDYLEVPIESKFITAVLYTIWFAEYSLVLWFDICLDENFIICLNKSYL